MLYSNFGNDLANNFGIINMPSGSDFEWGGHAYFVYGFDTNFRSSVWAQEAMQRGVPETDIPADVYLCRNTWSKEWGRKGDFAVAADFIDMLVFSDDAWTVRKVREPASAAVSP
jgi:C1A family cysteine protease